MADEGVPEQAEHEQALDEQQADEAGAGAKKRERDCSEDGTEPEAKRLNANDEDDDPPAGDGQEGDPAEGDCSGDDPPAAGADDPPGDCDDPPAAGADPPAAAADGDPDGDDREYTEYPDGSVSEVVHVPKTLVGKLIGKGGATIMGLQSSTACGIQVDQATASRGGECRRVTLKGMPAAVDAARAAVAAALAAEPAAAGSGGAPGGPSAAGGGPETSMEVPCPPGIVGRIIGRAGETIKLLQAASGAYILVNQNFPDGVDRMVTISGGVEAVERGANMVQDLIANDQVSVQSVIAKYGVGKTIHMQCPRTAAGRIIGRGGETVKMLQRKYNASVQLEQGSDPMTVTIVASPHEAEACQNEINAIINSPEGTMMGGGMMGMMGGRGMGRGGYGMPYGAPFMYGGYGGFPGMGAYGPMAGYGAMAYGGGYDAAAFAGMQQQPQQQYGGGAAAAPSASVWQAIPDDQGRTYYYNTQTGVSQWEKPADMP